MAEVAVPRARLRMYPPRGGFLFFQQNIRAVGGYRDASAVAFSAKEIGVLAVKLYPRVSFGAADHRHKSLAPALTDQLYYSVTMHFGSEITVFKTHKVFPDLAQPSVEGQKLTVLPAPRVGSATEWVPIALKSRLVSVVK